MTGAPLRGTGSHASHHARCAVDGPSGFDPARLRGVTADNYDPAFEAAFMLPRLDEAQRDFILRMRPVKTDQRLLARDWNAIECAVETGDDWPWRVWFGGMRAVSGAGQRGWKRTFRFNDAGLLLRAAIATEAGTAATVKQGAVHEGAGPKDIAQGGSHDL